MSKPGYWDKPVKRLESDLQSAIINTAEIWGWYVDKVESRSKRGLMDLLLIRKGRHVFIEAKREGEEAKRQQEIRARQIREHGGEVYTVDNIAQAREILK